MVGSWLARIQAVGELGGTDPGGRDPAVVTGQGTAQPAGTGALAAALTASLAKRPVFCDLQSVLATTLERHAGLAAAREYKRAAVGALASAGTRIAAGWGLSEQEGFEIAAAATTFAGMLWPVTHPPEVLRTLYAEEPELAIACPPFAPTLNRLIQALAEGLPALRTS